MTQELITKLEALSDEIFGPATEEFSARANLLINLSAWVNGRW